MGSTRSGAGWGASAPSCLNMASRRAGLLLSLPLLLLLLLSRTVPELVLGTTVMDATSTEPPGMLPSTAASSPPSSPQMGTSTLETHSTSPRSSSASAPTTPAHTAASAEPSTTPPDTKTTSITSTLVPKITPSPSQPLRTTAGTSPGISILTTGTSPDASMPPQSPNATMGTVTSSPVTNSMQSPGNTFSTSADLPSTQPTCPSTTSNASASHLFLSMRLTTPLDLENATVQELVLSKLRGHLQASFPCAGLLVQWRGKKRT